MKLVGAAFLAAYGGRFLNTHPALSPSFPGMHGPADALAYGVKVTGCTLFVVDDGVDTGPIVAQSAVPVARRRHRRVAARADQDPGAVDAGRGGRPDRPRGVLRRRPGRAFRSVTRVRVIVRATRLAQVGNHQGVTAPGPQGIDRLGARERHSRSTRVPTDRIPIRRALVSVYDKTGLDDLVRGLAEAGVELVSTGGSAARIESLGLPVTKVEDLTGFPECLDGRVKTLHPKVHAGILADRRLESHVAAARRPRHRAVRPRGLEPLPVRPDRHLGRLARRVRRADRHRRSVDGAGGGQEPPVGRDRDLARRLRRRAGRGGRGRLHARAAQAAGRRGVRPHRGVRRAGGVVDGQRAHRHQRRHRLPGVHRRDLAAPGGAPLRREPAPAGRALRPLARRARRGRAAARQGDVLQQLRRHRRRPPGGQRLRRADGGDHQARQPVRHRDRRRRRRGPPQGARLRPGLGVRRRDRGQPPGVDGDGRAGRRDVHRGDRGAGLRRRRGRDPAGQEEHPDPAVRRRRAPRPRRVPRHLRRRPDAAGRPRRRARRRPVDLDPRHRRGGPRRRAGRPRLRLAGLPVGEVQRDPARPRRCVGRHRHGPGQPGRLLPARGLAGGGAGRRVGGRLRRVLPVRGRAAGPDRRRRPRDRPARRVDARRADRQGLSRPPA